MSGKPMMTGLQFAPSERSSYVLPSLTVLTPLALWILVRKLGIGLVPFLETADSKPWIVLIAVGLILLFAVFSIGHVIDLLSHTILERFLADKLDGFPHERIVPVGKSTPRYIRFVRRKRTKLRRPTFFYEGAKLFVASLSAYFLLGIVARHPEITNNYTKVAIDIASTYFALTFVYSLLLALPAAIVGYLPVGSYQSRRLAAARFMKRTRKTVRASHWNVLWSAPAMAINYILAWPLVFSYDVFDKIIRGMFRLNKEIDPTTYERVEHASRNHLSIDYSRVRNNDRYWLPYFCLVALRPAAILQIKSARSSATYCRNQALACLLGALILAGVYKAEQASIPGLFSRADIIHIAIGLYLLGWIFHWRFLQQYYSCTKMALRVFATLPANDAKAGHKKTPKKVKEASIGPDELQP